MTAELVPGLPALVSFLTTFPPPENVARAVSAGALGLVDARVCMIWQSTFDRSELRLVSAYGPDAPIGRYATIPTTLDLPIVRAFDSGQIVITEMTDLLSGFPALSTDGALWADVVRETGVSNVVDAPIIVEGVSIGVVGVLVGDATPWTPNEFGLVRGVSSALGLWMTHQKSGVTEAGRPMSSDTDVPALTITPRQRRVLELVEQGKSNSAIAATLGYSESTVKQELKLILRALRVEDRHAAVLRARQIGLLT